MFHMQCIMTCTHVFLCAEAQLQAILDALLGALLSTDDKVTVADG
jgi:hypothetical protein